VFKQTCYSTERSMEVSYALRKTTVFSQLEGLANRQTRTFCPNHSTANNPTPNNASRKFFVLSRLCSFLSSCRISAALSLLSARGRL
jgi:hypothetical protein